MVAAFETLPAIYAAIRMAKTITHIMGNIVSISVDHTVDISSDNLSTSPLLRSFVTFIVFLDSVSEYLSE